MVGLLTVIRAIQVNNPSISGFFEASLLIFLCFTGKIAMSTGTRTMV